MSWCEIEHQPHGPVDHQDFCLAVQFRVHELDPQIVLDRVTQFTTAIPWPCRAWDAETRTWWVHPDVREVVIRFATTFPQAWLVEGDVITDLHSGAHAVKGSGRTRSVVV